MENLALHTMYNDNINLGGDQSLERQNLERPVFRNVEIANTKIKKDELFDNFIFKLFFIS